MILEFILIFAILFAVFVVAYKGAIHEFQILQKDWTPNIDWSAMLGEQLPIVIRDVNPEWMGGRWNRAAVEQKTWPIQVMHEGKRMRGQWNTWLAAPPGEPPIQNWDEITEAAGISLYPWLDGGFRRWNWLPVWCHRQRVGVLGPTDILQVRKTRAAITLLQATDGVPLQVWLAHEGAVPASVVGQFAGRDPWSLSTQEVPWIQEVKYVEVKVRPGNAIAIPTHWWWAVRPLQPIIAAEPTMADGAWYWCAEFQTPVSWIASLSAAQG